MADEAKPRVVSVGMPRGTQQGGRPQGVKWWRATGVAVVAMILQVPVEKWIHPSAWLAGLIAFLTGFTLVLCVEVFVIWRRWLRG